MDLNCSICRIASNRVPLPCSSPNFHLDATKSNANIKNTKILSYTKIHTYCVKKGLRRTANKRIHQKKHKKNYVSVNPQFVFITRNIWSFRLPHLYIWMFCFRYYEYCFFHFSLVHIFYLHFRTLIEIENWCVKTSGAETEFKFDDWKSRWQVLIGFQFCNTHTWFHQTFLSQRNLETFMYHSRKETERKKTQQRRNSLLVTIEVNK